MPCRSRVSSSGRKHRLRPSPIGAAKRPPSNRLVQRTSPDPSQKRIFSLTSRSAQGRLLSFNDLRKFYLLRRK